MAGRRRSAGQIKRLLKRGLHLIVDPHPNSVGPPWQTIGDIPWLNGALELKSEPFQRVQPSALQHEDVARQLERL